MMAGARWHRVNVASASDDEGEGVRRPVTAPRRGKNPVMITETYLLERLSDADLALLAGLGGRPGLPEQRAARLRRDPGGIEPLLGRPEVFAALFESGGEDPLVLVSPFAAFAVLVAHTSETLQETAFVSERVGRHRTVPVFEVEPLRAFLDDPLRRLFLGDLLASYTHVASGAFWMKGRRGWRHRRFSELDPVQLAELVAVVQADERVAVYRRLGDLTLFLCGVFPDYVESHPLAPIAVDRLRRALAGSAVSDARDEPGSLESGLGAQPLLEAVGRRSYRLAWAATQYHDLGLAPALGYVAEHYRHARMILSFLTDSYLRGMRGRWFPLGEG
jgi:hypothetical protein